MNSEKIIELLLIGAILFHGFGTYSVYKNDYTANIDGFVAPEVWKTLIALATTTIALIILTAMHHKYDAEGIEKSKKLVAIFAILALIAASASLYSIFTYTGYSAEFGGCFERFNLSIGQTSTIESSCKYKDIEITLARPEQNKRMIEIRSVRIAKEDFFNGEHYLEFFGGGPFTKYSSHSALRIPDKNLKIKVVNDSGNSAIIEIQRYS